MSTWVQQEPGHLRRPLTGLLLRGGFLAGMRRAFLSSMSGSPDARVEGGKWLSAVIVIRGGWWGILRAREMLQIRRSELTISSDKEDIAVSWRVKVLGFEKDQRNIKKLSVFTNGNCDTHDMNSPLFSLVLVFVVAGL